MYLKVFFIVIIALSTEQENFILQIFYIKRGWGVVLEKVAKIRSYRGRAFGSKTAHLFVVFATLNVTAVSPAYLIIYTYTSAALLPTYLLYAHKHRRTVTTLFCLCICVRYSCSRRRCYINICPRCLPSRRSQLPPYIIYSVYACTT